MRANGRPDDGTPPPKFAIGGPSSNSRGRGLAHSRRCWLGNAPGQGDYGPDRTAHRAATVAHDAVEVAEETARPAQARDRAHGTRSPARRARMRRRRARTAARKAKSRLHRTKTRSRRARSRARKARSRLHRARTRSRGPKSRSRTMRPRPPGSETWPPRTRTPGEGGGTRDLAPNAAAPGRGRPRRRASVESRGQVGNGDPVPTNAPQGLTPGSARCGVSPRAGRNVPICR